MNNNNISKSIVAIKIADSLKEADLEELKWFLCHENIVLFTVEDGTVFLEFATENHAITEAPTAPHSRVKIFEDIKDIEAIETKKKQYKQASEQKCFQCGRCCNYVSILLAYPDESVDTNYLSWLVSHDNVKLYLNPEDCLWLELSSPCNYRDENLKSCMIHDRRPQVCRDYPEKECDYTGDPDGDYKKIFHNAEEIGSYFSATK